MTRILALISVFILLACSNTLAQKASAAKDSTIYSCPMHPAVKEMKPGKCPKCGMALQKVEKTAYACPMHADATSSKPGKCPKCGMELVKINSKVYSCPMHESEVSDKPGKCSKCGMALKERKADD
jgi:hypothetical protein